jgi:hypothetical protein
VVTLFLGAGFSKWAFDLPLVNQLFDFDISTTSEQEEKKLALIEKDWADWRKENQNVTPEKFVYWCMNKSSHRKSRVIWYVSRRLTEPFMTRISGSYTAAMFDERAVRENEKIVYLKQFFTTLSENGLNGILTCNYDTIVECALGMAGFNYGIVGEQLFGRGINPQFPWQGAHRSVTGLISLAKLHGSLSWDKSTKYTSGKPGRNGKAFIVPPAPEKIPPVELQDVWELGAKLLKQSDCLIIFGFAFNPYDQALLEYLKVHGSKLKKVVLIDPYPNIDSAQKLWPQCSIETIDPRGKFDIADLLSKLDRAVVTSA